MRPRKRFGQHFLEAAWAQRLVAAIEPSAGDHFLEIGPGRGALTLPLARAARSVVAVEVDRDLVGWLRPRLPGNATVVEGDVLETPLADLLPAGLPPGGARVVGNLPYYISTPILFRLLEIQRASAPFLDACLMLQREVADRIAARPGTKAYGVLTVAVQLESDVSQILALPPGAFRPAPAVSSAVVRLRFRPPAVAVGDRAAFDALVRAIFAKRRKTLANSLRPFASGLGLDTAGLLAATGIDPGRRPETLGLEELAALASRLPARGPASVV